MDARDSFDAAASAHDEVGAAAFEGLTRCQLTREESELWTEPLTEFGELWAGMRLKAICEELRCVPLSDSLSGRVPRSGVSVPNFAEAPAGFLRGIKDERRV